ncbi:SIMPL domain-containing protein, partial [Candidatus Azambacteria bacterium]|nr:SIMPL domain-containing protein [Candidatus Azambacteria bacterium]
KDIKTEGYNLEPRYQNFNCSISSQDVKPCPPSVIVGYTITQTVKLKIRNFDQIGDILGGIVEQGANNVSQLSFSVDDPETLKNEAREKAIAQAQEKAMRMAKVAGFKLGRLVSVDDGSGLPIPYKTMMSPSYAGDMRGMATATVAPTIEPGSQEIVVNMTLRYEME